jgi:hypothetical protein
MRFGERQSECRFFHFRAEYLPIPLRINDLRTLPSPAKPVSSSQPTKPLNAPITPLESALTEVLIPGNLKLFGMNTYKKTRGEGILLLTTYPMRMRILIERSELRILHPGWLYGTKDPLVAPDEGSVNLQQTQRVHIHEHRRLRNLFRIAIDHRAGQQLCQHGPFWRFQ